MGLNVSSWINLPIKFKGTLTIDDFGGMVADSRIKTTDIILWSYKDDGFASANYLLGYSIPIDGELYFYVGVLLLSGSCDIVYIVLDGNAIPN